MPFIPLDLPPGVYRNGTLYQAKGRWYDSNLVRWASGSIGPVGGWQPLQASGSLNALANESAFEAMAWAKSNITVTDNSFTAPDGSMTGSLLNDTDDAELGTVTQSVSIATEFGPRFVQVYIARHIAAADAVCGIQVGFSGGSVSENETATVLFDPFTGEYALVQTGEDGDVMAVYVDESEGWWKITLGVRIIEGADYTTLTLTLSPAFSEDLVATVADPTVIGFAYFWKAGFYLSAPGDVRLGSAVVGVFPWNDNDNVSRVALGTITDAWHYAQGGLQNITPEGFVPGEEDAELASGVYSFGAYGLGSYGFGDASQTVLVEAQTWKFDSFGELLVAHASSDGLLYTWDLGSTSRLELMDEDAPTDNASVVITPERFVVALGADGDPRLIRWADQESLDVWAPTSENQAGDFRLPGAGIILNGLRGRGETLIWTSRDLWKMVFAPGVLVYRFEQVGNNCGPISRRAMVMVDGGKALWMGQKNFYGYDGFTAPLPSSVSDSVFSDINVTQVSKIFAFTISAQNEAWWFYPSAGSSRVNRYVVYNWLERTWTVGQLERSAGTDRGSREYPILGDVLGRVYDHETGTDYPDLVGNQLLPYLESGPIQIADGDNRMRVREIIPDANTLGAMNAQLYHREYPTAPESVSQVFNPANPTSTRVSGREIRLRVEQALPNWKLGVLRLELVQEGRR